MHVSINNDLCKTKDPPPPPPPPNKEISFFVTWIQTDYYKKLKTSPSFILFIRTERVN